MGKKVVIDRLTDYIHRPVGGALTSNGIQWSSEVTTADANVDVEVLSATVENGIAGAILWLEFGLTAAFRAVSSATADLQWKWQVRDKSSSTWVDLCDYVTETNIGTTYVERTYSGYFLPTTDITNVPFELRLLLQCNEANEGKAKVKNSSYVRAVYLAK